jgi:hypothetical protein
MWFIEFKSRKIILFILGFGFLFCFTYGEITRYPYLQPTEDLAHSVGIAWRTRELVSQTVYYREKGSTEWQTTTSSFTGYYVVDFQAEKPSRPGSFFYEFQIKTNENNYTESYVFRFQRRGSSDEHPSLIAWKLQDVYDPTNPTGPYPYPFNGLLRPPTVDNPWQDCRVKIRIHTDSTIKKLKIRIRKKRTTEWQEISAQGEAKHYVKLTNLKPGTEYEYKVNGAEEINSFLTSSWADDFSFRVVLWADNHACICNGEGSSDQERFFAEAIAEMLAFKPHLVIVCGDFAHGPNDYVAYDEEFSKGLAQGRELFANAIFCPVAGNHDTSEPNSYQFQIFAEQFYLPENGPEPNTTSYLPPAQREAQYRKRAYLKEANYSYNYGGIHFVTTGVGYVSFASYDDGFVASEFMEKPYEWLENDIQRALAKGVKNVIAVAHIIPYSVRKGREDRVPRSRNPAEVKLTNIFDRQRVAINFGGHQHCLQRTYPIHHHGNKRKDLGEITTREKKHYRNVLGTIYHSCYNPAYAYQAVPVRTIWKYQVAQAGNRGFVAMTVSEGGRKILVQSFSKAINQGPVGEKRLDDEYLIERDLSQWIENFKKKNKPEIFAYPNPFNPECYIPLNAKCKTKNVKCKIYNILGQLVREIKCSSVQEFKGSGIYWDGRDSGGLEVPSGVYFYEVAGEAVRKMVVLR